MRSSYNKFDCDLIILAIRGQSPLNDQALEKKKELQAQVDALSCDTESIANNADKIQQLEAQLREISLDLAVTVGSGTFGFGAIVRLACPYLIASPF